MDQTSYRSPNYSKRPTPDAVSIILHATVGSFKSSVSHLCNPAPGGNPNNAVSIHYIIDTDGSVYSLVDESHMAWHGGAGSIPGYSGSINALSIGIEFVNRNDGKQPYPKIQIDAGVELVKDIVKRRKIPRSLVLRHLDVARFSNGNIGRKTDPAPPAFDYQRFLDAVYGTTKHEGPILVDGDQLVNKKYTVICNTLRIRQSPNLRSPISGILKFNQTPQIDIIKTKDVQIVEGCGEWGHLDEDGRGNGRGFVLMKYLQP